MYLRSVKKLISPGVASLSDAAPVIFSAGSPTNLPSARSASCLIVKLIGKTVREGEFASQVKWLGTDDRLATVRRARRSRPTTAGCNPSAVRASFPAGRPFFDKCLHAFKRCFVHHVARHDLTCRVVRIRDMKLGLAVERFFSHCDGDTWLANDRRD